MFCRRALRSLLHAIPLLLLLAAAAPGQPQSPLVLEGLGRATLPLGGTWQFHPGDDPSFASPALDDSTWQPILTGQPWEAQGHYGLTGFAWYRRHLILPPGQPTAYTLALYLTAVDSAAEVYWNGQLVGRIGRVPPHPLWYFVFAPAPPAIPLGQAGSGILAIRVWKAPILFNSGPAEGGLLATPQIGSTQAVDGLIAASRFRSLQSNQFNLAFALISAILFFIAFGAWLRDRKRTFLLWLALAMVFPVAILIIVDLPGAINFFWAYGTIAFAVTLNDVAIWFLLIDLLGLRDNRRLVRLTTLFAITCAVVDTLEGLLVLLFDWVHGNPHLVLAADISFTIPLELLEFWGVVLVLFALRKRLDAASWFLAVTALASNVVQALVDISDLGSRWTHWTLYNRVEAPLFTLFTVPFTIRSVDQLLFFLAILYAALRYALQQNQRQAAVEQEFRSAQAVQQVLIPDTLPAISGYTVSSAYLPAQEVGGDFFQLIELPNDAALLILGDVSGKGLAAAMAVALIVGAIRTAAESTTDPATLLAILNRRLHGRLRGGFATCLALQLDAGGACTLANAGHLPPFRNGEELPLPPALPLGILPDADFDSATFHLAPGDQLTLYTDGLLEATSPTGELFGFPRIAQLLASPRTAPSIAAAARHFGQEDDITVLTLTLAGRSRPL